MPRRPYAKTRALTEARAASRQPRVRQLVFSRAGGDANAPHPRLNVRSAVVDWHRRCVPDCATMARCAEVCVSSQSQPAMRSLIRDGRYLPCPPPAETRAPSSRDLVRCQRVGPVLVGREDEGAYRAPESVRGRIPRVYARAPPPFAAIRLRCDQRVYRGLVRQRQPALPLGCGGAVACHPRVASCGN